MTRKTATHNTNIEQTPTTMVVWSRQPLQRHGFDESKPPKGWAAMHIFFPRPSSNGLIDSLFSFLGKNSMRLEMQCIVYAEK